MNVFQTQVRPLPVADRWCVMAYYSLSPYAPDKSGRLLMAGADLDRGVGEVLVLDADRKVVDRFGSVPVTPSFWHTGLWQSWSRDGRYVYYQSGTHREPRVVRRTLSTGQESEVAGDMEGICPAGEPGVACAHGMLYAAGYGSGHYRPELSPFPFQSRDAHGMWNVSFDPPTSRLVLSTQQILDSHPHRDRLLEADREIAARLGPGEGLTLMTYCVRWNNEGSRCLFYFGNHCVDRSRGEPRLAYVFTADRDLRDIRLALDFGFGRYGVHWSWQPDNERLIGYGPDPDHPGRTCLAEVRYDGSGYRRLSGHASGGHPSVSPIDDDLIVTDEGGVGHGNVLFLSRRTGEEIARIALPKNTGVPERGQRDATRVCHHPAFSPTGDRVLCNTLPGRHATCAEILIA
ncbi:MAG TPA: hypothetical protein VGN72_19500 [Tepidisphaeraceae bacterium]|nr:hypothetical protein [Tepidisphaeraceae bacterium]